MKINVEKVLTINKIIERDKLESSYKLALLKSLILTIKKFDHHIIENKEFVRIPFYFIVEEWFFYYLPFVYLNIKQHKSNKLVLNSKIETLYNDIFTLFSSSCKQNDWKCIYALIYKKYFNFELNTNAIFKEFRRLIINNPMKYIGEIEYELFPKEKITKSKKVTITRRNFTDFGYFEIEKETYTILKYLGDNFYGKNTILFRWEELLYKLNSFKNFEYIKNILTHNIDEISRDTTLIRKFLSSIKEPIFCIWSGKRLSSFEVDHLLPFSIFFNNDYWNLLPTDPKINNIKKDKIPSPSLIQNSQERIERYWNLYKKEFKNFKIQREISLGKFEKEEEYLTQLISKSSFLIKTLGYEPFEV